MSSDTKSLKIGLALLAPVLALFIALAIIVSVRASVHTSPSPETLQATTTPTLEAQITASITHNSASGIVNALASACTQRIALHFDESSADAILTRAPPSDLYKGIALLKKDCPTSPAIPILLRAYLPRAITDHDTTPATAKLVTDFPETAPPPIFLKHPDGAALITAYKLSDQLTAVLRTYALPSDRQNFSSFELWNNATSKTFKGVKSINAFSPHHFIYYPTAAKAPATYFLCKDMAGDMCAYWSTELITTNENSYILSGGLFDNPPSPSVAEHQTSGNADVCQFRVQLLKVKNSNIQPIYSNNSQSPCPGGGINAASPHSLNPLSLVDIDGLLRKLGPHPARAQKLVALVDFRKPDLADDSIKAHLSNSLAWAAKVREQIHPPKPDTSPDKTIASNTQAFHDYLQSELTYLRELQWALGNGVNFHKAELQATRDLTQAEKLATGIPSDLIDKPFGATNYQNLTFAVIRSQVEVGGDGMPRIATYGTRGGKILIVYSEKPLLKGLYSPVITAPVIRDGNATVVLGNGDAIEAEAYKVAPPNEIAGWSIAKSYAEQMDHVNKRFEKLNSCLGEYINDFSQPGVAADLLDACQGELQ